MLVLTRKTGESVIIGERPNLIKVTVLPNHGHGSAGIRLGFDADKSVPIHRAEAYKVRTQRQKLKESS